MQGFTHAVTCAYHLATPLGESCDALGGGAHSLGTPDLVIWNFEIRKPSMHIEVTENLTAQLMHKIRDQFTSV